MSLPDNPVPASIGRVVGLWRYPVKSMAGEVLARAEIAEAGIVGDRAFGVFDADTGNVLTAKRVPQLLAAAAAWRSDGEVSITIASADDGVSESMSSDDTDVDSQLSSWLGRPVQLRRPAPGARSTVQMETDLDDTTALFEFPTPPGTLFDSRAVLHLLTPASLRSGESLHPEGRWVTARFRPNVLVETPEGPQGWVEDAWVGSELHLGGVRVTVRKPCQRCVMTTRAQPGLERDLEVMRTLSAFHDANLGVYLDVTGAGSVLVGDEVLQEPG